MIVRQSFHYINLPRQSSHPKRSKGANGTYLKTINQCLEIPQNSDFGVSREGIPRTTLVPGFHRTPQVGGELKPERVLKISLCRLSVSGVIGVDECREGNDISDFINRL
jgi:hypothetical protein